MCKFNHLKNVCEFLDAADNFEYNLYEENFEHDERLRDDPALKYDEDASRETFSETIYNLLIEDGADVEKAMADRLTTAFTNAFYSVNSEHYSEAAALQRLLRATNAAAQRECDKFNAGDYSFSKFRIIVGDDSAEFLIGGPQLSALHGFIQHIAAENFYDVDIDAGTVTGGLY